MQLATLLDRPPRTTREWRNFSFMLRNFLNAFEACLSPVIVLLIERSCSIVSKCVLSFHLMHACFTSLSALEALSGFSFPLRRLSEMIKVLLLLCAFSLCRAFIVGSFNCLMLLFITTSPFTVLWEIVVYTTLCNIAKSFSPCLLLCVSS